MIRGDRGSRVVLKGEEITSSSTTERGEHKGIGTGEDGKDRSSSERVGVCIGEMLTPGELKIKGVVIGSIWPSSVKIDIAAADIMRVR